MTYTRKCAMSTVKYQADAVVASDENPPMAIVSGENIYIVYPTGTVSAIKKSLTDCLKIKELLAHCDFWGDLAIF